MPRRTELTLFTFLLITLPAFLLPATTNAQTDNLALHTRYEWSPAPNYSGCADSNDNLQLTDGKRLGDSRGWLNQEMVGWNLHRGSRVQLTLELAEVSRINEIIVSTRLATDSEVLPPSVVSATSLDGDNFSWATAHNSRRFHDHSRGGSHKIDLRMRLEAARTGRWVHLIFTLQEDFLFIDEIEVLGQTLSSASTDSAIAVPNLLSGPVFTPAVNFQRSDSDLVARQQRHLWALRKALPGPLDPSLRFPQATVDQEQTARFAKRGLAWRNAALSSEPPVIIRRVEPLAVRDPWSDLGTEVRDTLRVTSGTWAAIAVDVAATLDTTLGWQVQTTDSTLATTLRYAAAVEARSETWRDDALPLLIETLTLQAGQTRQLWIDVDATATAPGMFSVHIRSGNATITVPVRVHAALEGHEAPLVTLNFTYPTNREILQNDPIAAIADNRAAGINSWIMDRGAVPWPRRAAIDDSGARQERLDYAQCDAQLQQYAQMGESSQLGWYWNFWMENQDPSGGRFQNAYFSDAWKRAVSQWLHEWTHHLTTIGYPPERVFMQPVDERGNLQVRDLYRLLKGIAPEVRLAVTLSLGQSQADLRALLPWLDIAILNREILRDSDTFIERMHAKGSEVWLYDVPSPAKASSPTEAYRMLAWEAWALGLQGCVFWSYAHVAGDSWDDFDGRHADFSVVYANQDAHTAESEAFVPSRRWRAFRMGMQDVQRFAALDEDFPSLRQEVDVAIHDAQRRAALLRRSFQQ